MGDDAHDDLTLSTTTRLSDEYSTLTHRASPNVHAFTSVQLQPAHSNVNDATHVFADLTRLCRGCFVLDG